MNEDCASERAYSRQDVDPDWRTSFFPVEIHLAGLTEEALTRRITTIQHWLNEHSFEPFTFHYTFFDAGIALRIDFKFESEALAFADQFSGIGAYLARAVGPYSPGGLEKPAKVSRPAGFRVMSQSRKAPSSLGVRIWTAVHRRRLAEAFVPRNPFNARRVGSASRIKFEQRRALFTFDRGQFLTLTHSARTRTRRL